SPRLGEKPCEISAACARSAFTAPLPAKNLVAASEQNHLNIRRATERLGQGEVRRSNGTCRNLRSHQQAALVPTGGRGLSNDRGSFIAGPLISKRRRAIYELVLSP